MKRKEQKKPEWVVKIDPTQTADWQPLIKIVCDLALRILEQKRLAEQSTPNHG